MSNLPVAILMSITIIREIRTQKHTRRSSNLSRFTRDIQFPIDVRSYSMQSNPIQSDSIQFDQSIFQLLNVFMLYDSKKNGIVK